MQENNTINELIAIVVSDMGASGDKPTTDSIKVAERFGKRHADVLRSIKNMDCSTEFTQRNFALSEFTDSTGRKLPMFHMTKDGFAFLAMGFTGKEAARWKEAYIGAFNAMSDALSHHVSFAVPADLYARALQAEKDEAASKALASVAGKALSLRRKEKKVLGEILVMLREEVQLKLMLGYITE